MNSKCSNRRAGTRQPVGWVAIAPSFETLKCVIAVLLFLACSSTASAATLYWSTTTGTWATLTNWSDDPSSGGTNPTAAPTNGDVAWFNQTGVTGSTTVRINAATAIDGLVFTNSGLTTFNSPAATQVLSLGSGGITLQEGSGGLTISSSSTQVLTTTLTADQSWTNDSSGALSVVSGTINASGTRALTIAGSGSTTISAALANGAAGNQLAIVKQGPGLLRLDAANNSFSGGFTLDSGTVLIANTGALGLAGTTLTLNGGTLDPYGAARTLLNTIAWNGDFTFAGSNTLNTGTAPITLGGAGTSRQVTVNASTLTIGGTVSGPGMTLVKKGAGALTVTRPLNTTTGGVTLDGGLLTLSASNSFTGGVRLVAGTLSISNTQALGGTAGTITIEGGTLNVGITDAAGYLYMPNYPYAVNGDFSQIGGGVLHLGTGPFTLGGPGTRRVVTSSALIIGGTVSGDGMTLVKRGAGYLTISGVVDGTAGVEVDGGKLTLSRSNSHSGGTWLTSGTLIIANNAALGAASGTFTIAGGSLDVTTGFALSTNNPISWIGDFTYLATNSLTLGTGPVTLGGSGSMRTVTANNWDLTMPGPISGVGLGITKAGPGNFALSGSNSFTGGVTLAAGMLRIANNYALGAASGTFTIQGGTTLQSSLNLTLANNNPQVWIGDVIYTTVTAGFNLGTGAVTLSGTGSSRVVSVPNYSTITVGGPVSGAYGLVKSGVGTLTLNGSNSYSGSTTLQAGTLQPGRADALGTTGDISFTGGTLQYTGSVATDFAPRIKNSTSAISLAVGSTPVTFAGNIDSTNSGGLTVTTNTLTLSGSNSYSGGTNLGAVGASTAGVRININNASALGTGPFYLNQSNSFDNTSGGPLTVPNNIVFNRGSASAGFVGTNNLEFSGTAILAGAMSIGVTSGTLTFATLDATAGNIGLTVSTGAAGTLFIRGPAGPTVGTTGGSITLNSGQLLLGNRLALGGMVISTGNGNMLAAAVDMSGTNSLPTNYYMNVASNIFNGTNSITMSGTVSQGTSSTLFNALPSNKELVLAGPVLLFSSTAATVVSMTFTGSTAPTTITGTISNGGAGANSVVKSGVNLLTLSGANSFTGATSVTGGLLRINGSTHPSSAVGVSAGALGGTGTVGGPVTLTTAGGVDLRDGAVGILTLGSTLGSTGLASANNLSFDLGAAEVGTDKIAVTGAFSMTTSGAGVVTVNQLGVAGSRANTNGTGYDIITAASGLSAANFQLLTTKAFGQTFGLSTPTATALKLTTAQVSAVSNNTTLSGASPSWQTTGNFSGAAIPDYLSNVTINSAITTGSLNASVDVNSLIYGGSATTSTTVAPGTAAAGTPFNMLVIEAGSGTGITVNTPTSGTPTQTISANIGIASSQTWSVASGGILAATGVVSDFGGGYALTKDGTGMLILSGANTFTGGVTLTAGTVNLGSAESAGISGPLGKVLSTTVGSIVLNGGTLQTSAANSFDYSGRFSTAASQKYNLDNAQNVTWATALTSNGGTLTKSGTGTLTLTAANTFNGATAINGGTLTLGVGVTLAGPIANNSALSVLGTAVTLAAQITGTGSFATSGGSVVLSNPTSVLGGSITIPSGLLEFAGAFSGTAGITMGSTTLSGTLRYTGSGQRFGVLNMAGTTGGVTLDSSGSGPLVFSSAMTATGAGIKTLTLTGSSTAANSIAAIPNSSAATSVNKTGNGTWRMTGTSSFTGQLTVTQGTIVAAVGTGPSGNGVFGQAVSPSLLPMVGDSAAGASGFAAMLLEDGVVLNRSLQVAALGSGANQLAILGGANTSGTSTFAYNTEIRIGRGVSLQAATGGTVDFGNVWLDSTGSASPAFSYAIGTAGNLGTVRLSNPLATTSGSVSINYGTLLFGANNQVASSTPVSIGSSGGNGTLNLDGNSLALSQVNFNGAGSFGGTVANSGTGTLTIQDGIAAALIQVNSGTAHAINSAIAMANATTVSVASSAQIAISGAISGASGLTKIGSGALTLSGNSLFSGATTVSAGTLVVNGSLASTAGLNVDSGAFLGGSGSLASTIAGAGLVGPGNSPGILTALAVDPSAGTDFSFELTGTGAPAWSVASASVNDVLHLTSASPFTSTTLTGSNAVNIYFQVASLAVGDTFQGGFFTDATLAQSNLLTNVSAGQFNYFVKGDGGSTSNNPYNGVNYYTLAEYLGLGSSVAMSTQTVSSANFATGTVTNGQVVELVIVPEPDTMIFAGIGIGMAAWSIWKRRRIAQIMQAK